MFPKKKVGVVTRIGGMFGGLVRILLTPTPWFVSPRTILLTSIHMSTVMPKRLG